MAVAGAFYDAGTNAAALMPQVWSKTIHRGIYQSSLFMQRVRMYERLYSQLSIRKLKRLGTQTLANSADGTGLTYSANQEVDVDITPTFIYCAVAFPQNTKNRVDFSPGSVFTTEVENALREAAEADFLEMVPTLTGQVGGAGVEMDAAILRTRLALLRNRTRNNVQPGKATLYGLFHDMQYDDISSVPEWNNAEVVGDSKGAHRSGTILKASGTEILFSSVVYVDPATQAAYNPIWHEDCFGQTWNQKFKVEEERIELQDRIICHCEYGTSVVRDEFGQCAITASV